MSAQPGTPVWVRTLGLLLVLLLPVVALLTGVRLLLTETFVTLEYRTPGFPADPYGFTLQDRLHWAPLALDYLLNDEGIDFLAKLQFADGAPVFNARELKHMDDVKRVVRGALVVWAASLLAAGVIAVVFWRTHNLRQLWLGLRRGSTLTLALMGALVIALVAGFSLVFVGFHRMFFEGNSWLFQYSDTLIRLFPERFWRDTFLLVVALTIIEALLLRLPARLGLARIEPQSKPGPPPAELARQ